MAHFQLLPDQQPVSLGVLDQRIVTYIFSYFDSWDLVRCGLVDNSY